MRLAVLDTNVIVSAGIKPGGAPATLIMDWVLEGQIQVVTSLWVVSEYREVVRRAKFRRYGFPQNWLEFMIEESLRLPDPALWAKQGPDPKDMPFLALAHVAGAWLVTGNVKDFAVAVRNGVAVVSPGEYLKWLGGRLFWRYQGMMRSLVAGPPMAERGP